MTKQKPVKLESLIKKVPYYYVNSDITEEHFPTSKTIRPANWKLIPILSGQYWSSKNCLEEIKKSGYRPANCYELAQWSVNHREEVEKGKWYIALGQTWKDAYGRHRVPRVRARSDGAFKFGLGDFEDGWGDSSVLLCFCDLPLAPKKLRVSSDTLTLENRVAELERKINGIHIEFN